MKLTNEVKPKLFQYFATGIKNQKDRWQQCQNWLEETHSLKVSEKSIKKHVIRLFFNRFHLFIC